MICTFPGRFGDILWALPTVRAISEREGRPVDLMIAAEFASLVPLLEQQPYLQHVYANQAWGLTPPDEWRPPNPPEGALLHLGYRGWPDKPLPYYIAEQAGVEIDLLRPWIVTYETLGMPVEIAVGFTEAWFELKVGVCCAALELPDIPPYCVLTVPGSRWVNESHYVSREVCGWIAAAAAIRNSDLFFGDCSALHVLAVALGKTVVLMEPMEGRWNPIFYPLGMDGPHVTVVKGNDGRPTFDARHCADTIRKVLRG